MDDFFFSVFLCVSFSHNSCKYFELISVLSVVEREKKVLVSDNFPGNFEF